MFIYEISFDVYAMVSKRCCAACPDSEHIHTVTFLAEFETSDMPDDYNINLTITDIPSNIQLEKIDFKLLAKEMLNALRPSRLEVSVSGIPFKFVVRKEDEIQ